MPDYQAMYHILFNEMSKAINLLQKAQIKTEEMYINAQETLLTLPPQEEPEE